MWFEYEIIFDMSFSYKMDGAFSESSLPMLYPELMFSVGVGIPTDYYLKALNPEGVSRPMSTEFTFYSKLFESLI